MHLIMVAMIPKNYVCTHHNYKVPFLHTPLVPMSYKVVPLWGRPWHSEVLLLSKCVLPPKGSTKKVEREARSC